MIRHPSWRALALLLWLVPAAARAQVVKPWTPAGADSIGPLVSEAKVRFRQTTTDSIDDQTMIPFERVAQAARRLLRRLGRDHMLMAPSIEASLDSLGLDTDVVNDPDLPSIVFVMVRNPYRLSEQAVGYLIWYRGIDLRMQGAAFPPALRPRIKSWWSSRPTHPYSAAIVYESRGTSPVFGFKYFQLSGDGYYWDLVQYEGHGPNLGSGGGATFADIDGDGRPELLSFAAVAPDSVLTAVSPVRPIMREAIYTDRGAGFVVHDARVVPGPLATLDLFLTWLRDRNPDAHHLVVDPALADQAVKLGWADLRNPRSFLVDQQEEGQAWPEWLGVRVVTKAGGQRYAIHFTLQEGHWLIKDWVAEQPAGSNAARIASPDSTGGRKP